MPSTTELIELRELLLAYALGAAAEYQKEAVRYIFGRIIERGENQTINVTDMMHNARPKNAPDAEYPQGAVYELKRDIGLKLDAFYDGSPDKAPHEKSSLARYRVKFSPMKGNYIFAFEDRKQHNGTPDLVPVFWKPHLPPQGGVAKTLYPEPIFLIDERQTYFRNAAVGSGPNFKALDYLQIPGNTPKTGYSYVPSGIVKSLIDLGKALRPHDCNRPGFFPCEAVKPYTSLPPGGTDLILLSTPTSTDLVDTLQGGQDITVDAQGVHVDGKTYDDTEREKWGVLTRTREQHRTITILAAKHGRSVEAMMSFLVLSRELVKLARRMSCAEDFPETFQVLFRMEAKDTREGPSLKEATISDYLFADGKRIV